MDRMLGREEKATAALAGHRRREWAWQTRDRPGIGWCAWVILGGHVDLPQRIIWCIMEQVFLGRYVPPR